MESAARPANWNGIARKSKLMKISIERKPLEQVETDALLVLVFEDAKEQRFNAGTFFESKEIQGKLLELTLLHHPDGVAAQRVLLAGAGKRQKFDTAALRKVAGAAARYLKSK